MNKKIIAVIALVLVLTIGLVACNGKTYKSSGVADGNKYASSPVENNGSFVVKQGGYVYFVNAYVGADAENKFGKQEKSCLYRAELDENGNIITFELFDIVEVDEREYALLLPTDAQEGDEDELVLMRLTKDGEDYLFETIDDDDEFNRVAEYVENLAEEDDDEE